MFFCPSIQERGHTLHAGKVRANITLAVAISAQEYKNVREHLLSNLPGDRAWRYDKAQYPSLQNRRGEER